MRTFENIDFAGYVEIVDFGGETRSHQRIGGLGKRPGTIQNETNAGKRRCNISRRVEREHLRGEAQISGQFSDLRRVSASKNRKSASFFRLTRNQFACVAICAVDHPIHDVTVHLPWVRQVPGGSLAVRLSGHTRRFL
jgi:hypothetical protein